MRVGLLAYGLHRPLTGIGRYTVEMARVMASLLPPGDLTILSAGSPARASNGLAGPVMGLPGCGLLPGLLTLGNGVVPLASRRARLEIVHDPAGVAPFLLGASGARTVVTVHDVFPWSCPGNSTLLDRILHHYWLPRLLRHMDLVITDSEASRRDISKFLRLPSSKIRVIYPGVGAPYRLLSTPAVKEGRGRLGLPGSYILFVGSVERRKNLERLVQACATLWRDGEQRSLVIAGPAGRVRSGTMAALAGLGVEDRVVFPGYVAERDLPLVYAGADLFLFPSLYEGFGLPPLEAMACGTPVVCSNTSSLPEVVGDAAVTVDPLDIGAIAEAMRPVLSSPFLQEELRERGLARARSFTWERTARRTVELYREVLEDHPVA